MKYKLTQLIAVILIAAFVWQSIASADGSLRPLAAYDRHGGAANAVKNRHPLSPAECMRRVLVFVEGNTARNFDADDLADAGLWQKEDGADYPLFTINIHLFILHRLGLLHRFEFTDPPRYSLRKDLHGVPLVIRDKIVADICGLPELQRAVPGRRLDALRVGINELVRNNLPPLNELIPAVPSIARIREYYAGFNAEGRKGPVDQGAILSEVSTRPDIREMVLSTVCDTLESHGTVGPLRILSLGSGRGELEKGFQDRGHEVLGIDASLENAKIARQNGVFTIVADAHRLPIKALVNRKFRLGLFSESVGHMKIPDVFDSIKDQIADDGWIVVTSYEYANLDPKAEYDSTGYIQYSPDHIREALSRSGFRTVLIKPIYFGTDKAGLPRKLNVIMARRTPLPSQATEALSSVLRPLAAGEKVSETQSNYLTVFDMLMQKGPLTRKQIARRLGLKVRSLNDYFAWLGQSHFGLIEYRDGKYSATDQARQLQVAIRPILNDLKGARSHGQRELARGERKKLEAAQTRIHSLLEEFDAGAAVSPVSPPVVTVESSEWFRYFDLIIGDARINGEIKILRKLKERAQVFVSENEGRPPHMADVAGDIGEFSKYKDPRSAAVH